MWFDSVATALGFRDGATTDEAPSSGMARLESKLTKGAEWLKTYERPRLDRQQLENLYRGNWIARKAVDIVPYDMTRAGRAWQAEEDQITAIETAERKLDVTRKLFRWLSLGRLYGSSIMVLGTEVGSATPEAPLNVEGIARDGLKYLHVLHRHQYSFSRLIDDPREPFFGEPEFYEVRKRTGEVIKIHPSRVLHFEGAPVPSQSDEIACTGDSILEVVFAAVNGSSTALANVAELIFEAKIDVIKVDQLADMLATEEGTRRVEDRFAAAAAIKTNTSMLLLSGSEEFDRKQITFGSLPDLLREFLQVVSGAVDIPATRFLSQSPGGMNSTGESDIRNYYDQISARQEVDLRPAIDRLDEALIRHALGNRPSGLWYEFNPLWQMTAKEKAEIGKLNAETSKIYAVEALVPPMVLEDAVKKQLVESGHYPGIEQSYKELENAESVSLAGIGEEDDPPEGTGDPAPDRSSGDD